MRFQFADCTIDSEARTLSRAGADVHLAPKAFELLKVLVDHRPRAIPKSELLERVWPGVFVSDASLAKLVSKVRDAIGDNEASPMIRTMHGFGYAFVAPVEVLDTAPPAPAKRQVLCWLFCGAREFPLADGEHILGRDSDVSIHLDSPKVSRRHARLVIEGTHATLEDLGSKNGSYARGVRIAGPTPLESGDEVGIGPFKLLFRVTRDSGSTETEIW